MSTLRISNIEAKSVPASATVDEKVKITNSSGDTLVFIDGKTSGITTVGINTTDGNITFDANSNVVVTGIITATRFSGQITPTSLEIGSNIKLGNAGVITATSFVGSGANLTNLPTQVTITDNADDRVITGGSGVNLNGESTMTYTSSLLKLATASSTSTDAELLHLVGGGTATRGLKISTGRASGASQNHAAAIYDAIDSESNAYGAQHRFKIAGTDCFTIGYNGDKGFVGINDNVPYPDSVSSNTVNTCLELGSPSGTDTASVIKFRGRDGSGNLNKCQMQWAGANNRFDITVNGNQALQIQPNKDVEVTDGDLVIGTSGHGINFSATADSSEGSNISETLDDYEKGDIDLVLTGSNGGSPSLQYRTGHYTKIGNICHVTGDIRFNGSWSGSTGDLYVGLPFVSESSGGCVGAGVVSEWNLTASNWDNIMIKVDNNESIARFTAHSGANNNTNNFQTNLFGSGRYLKFSFTYQTA